MQQLIIWLVALIVIGAMFAALINDSSRRKRRTTQEFERDLAEQRSSMLRAGMLELDGFVGQVSQKRAAVEFLKDQEEGQTKTGSSSDDSLRTLAKEESAKIE
jgi:Flp pilus assembly protein TadB